MEHSQLSSLMNIAILTLAHLSPVHIALMEVKKSGQRFKLRMYTENLHNQMLEILRFTPEFQMLQSH